MNKKRILVVEDNEVNMKTLVSILKKTGYEVICTENGEEAIEIAKNEEPDLILLDINIPGKNGFEVVETLRSFPETKNIPVCFITGLLDKEEEEKLEHLLLGNFFFSKPFDTERLLEEIKKRI